MDRIKPVGIILFSIMLVLVGVANIVLAWYFLKNLRYNDPRFDSNNNFYYVGTMGILYLILGITYFLIVANITKFKRWTRDLLIALLLAQLGFNIPSMMLFGYFAMGFGPGGIVIFLGCIVYIGIAIITLIYFGRPKVKALFKN